MVATASLVLAFGLLTAVLLYTVPVADLSRIRDLLSVDAPSVARSVLASWPASTFQTFAFLLGFDFLYDLVHNNAVALFAIWGAKRQPSRNARLVASLTAWVMWFDTGINVFENLAILHILQTLEPAPLLPFAASAFSFRSVTLAVGLLVGVCLHLLAFRR